MKKFLFVLTIVLLVACVALCLAACGKKKTDDEPSGDTSATKTAPTYVVPANLSVAYGLTLGDLPLPDGFSWQDALTTSVGEVGQNTFKVTYTPADTTQYETVRDISVVITVTRTNPTYTLPTGLTATYGQTLADVALPAGFAWADATQSVGTAGTHSFAATYTPADATHYNVVGNLSLSVAVAKATYDMSGVTFASASYTYDGTEHSVVIAGTLPQGVSVRYENNTRTNVGNITATAIFVGDTDNYEAIADMTATLYITKGTYDLSGITFENANYVYNGEEHSLCISGELPQGVSVRYENNTRTNAGSTTATAIFAGDADNYEAIADMTATLTINKATAYLDPTGSNFVYTYDGNKHLIENLTNVSGPFTYTVDGEPCDGYSAPGNYFLTVNVQESDNYLAGTFSMFLYISPATISNISIEQMAPLTYTGDNLLPELRVLSTTVKNQPVTFTFATEQDGEYEDSLPYFRSAGTHTVYYKANAFNHQEATGNFEIVIGKAEMTVTAHDEIIDNGAAAPAFSVYYKGFMGGETTSTPGIFTGEIAFDCDYQTGGAAGDYDIVPKGLSAPNYNLTFVKGTLTVRKPIPANAGELVTPYGFEATFGDLLSSVVLPEGWYWVEGADATVGNAGEADHQAKYVQEGYEDVLRTVTIAVAKADIDVPGKLRTWLFPDMRYGDLLYDVALLKSAPLFPSGWDYVTSGYGNYQINEAIDSQAHFKYVNANDKREGYKGNYNDVEDVVLTFEVVLAEGDDVVLALTDYGMAALDKAYGDAIYLGVRDYGNEADRYRLLNGVRRTYTETMTLQYRAVGATEWIDSTDGYMRGPTVNGKPTSLPAGDYEFRATMSAAANFHGATELTGTFTIRKKNSYLSYGPSSYNVSLSEVEDNLPFLPTNPEDLPVTYEYKPYYADDDAYTTKVPDAFGVYMMRASYAGDANRTAAVTTAKLIVDKNYPIYVYDINMDAGYGCIYHDEDGDYYLRAEVNPLYDGTLTYEYKVADADDSTYTTKVPTAPGEYVLRITATETEMSYGEECICYLLIHCGEIDSAYVDAENHYVVTFNYGNYFECGYLWTNCDSIDDITKDTLPAAVYPILVPSGGWEMLTFCTIDYVPTYAFTTDFDNGLLEPFVSELESVYALHYVTFDYGERKVVEMTLGFMLDEDNAIACLYEGKWDKAYLPILPGEFVGTWSYDEENGVLTLVDDFSSYYFAVDEQGYAYYKLGEVQYVYVSDISYMPGIMSFSIVDEQRICYVFYGITDEALLATATPDYLVTPWIEYEEEGVTYIVVSPETEGEYMLSINEDGHTLSQMPMPQ